MFDKEQLIKECTNLFRVITAKDFGTNKLYSEYMKDFEKTIHYNVQVMFDKDGSVVWKSYDDKEKPFYKDAYIEYVDVAFSPGFRFGNDDASLILYGELLPYGEEGSYSEVFIRFEELTDKVDFAEESNCDGLFIVHNTEELGCLMCIIKEQWDWRASFDIKYTQMLDELYNYIDEFKTCELNRWLKLFGNIQYNIPIVFHRGYSEDNDYIKGDFNTVDTDVVVNIYQCNLNDIDELKTAVRHEMIHYGLYSAGLPYWDDCAVFWYFALKLDAKPYKELNDEEQEMLDFLNIFEDDEIENVLLDLKDKLLKHIK